MEPFGNRVLVEQCTSKCNYCVKIFLHPLAGEKQSLEVENGVVIIKFEKKKKTGYEVWL